MSAKPLLNLTEIVRASLKMSGCVSRKASSSPWSGHSGCGKSTLLNIIAGLEKATRAAIILDGREIDHPGLDRMVVFQNFSLLPWMSVYDNIRIAVRAAYPDWEANGCTNTFSATSIWSGLPARTQEACGVVRRHAPARRIGTWFAVQPKVLLLDEPFAQIDALTRGTIQEELMRMWMATKNTVFMVTHDVEEAILLSDKIALMTSGPEARLAHIVDVRFPRPRVREQLTELQEYARIKKQIIQFLTN